MNNTARVLSDDDTTVLIVSSHGHLRSHYTAVLNTLGVRIVAVSDAFEALDFLRNQPVHAIFADFMLPGISGIDLFFHMKSLEQRVPFIICSPEFNARFRDDVLKIGVFKIVRAPMHSTDIRKGVQLAIEERERQILQFFC